MALTLDLRSPLLVLVAQFNPAIFEFPWIAKHILEADEGAAVQALEVIMQLGSVGMRLQFFEGVAINVQPGRTDFLVQNGDAASFKAVEDRLTKLLAVLPHTPVAAIGCNFRFNDPQPPQNIIDLFDTPEGLEGEFNIKSRQSTTQLEVEGGVLNFSRTLSDAGCDFSFNYHRDETDAQKYADFVPGMVQAHLDHAAHLLNTTFGYGAFEKVGFVTEVEPGENADEQPIEA
jgi:hypothetical protein